MFSGGMLPDPDQETERWDEPIVASDPEAAKKECSKRAEQYGVDLESVTTPRKIEKRSQVYRCNYKERG